MMFFEASSDAVDPNMFAGVGQNAEKVWIEPVDGGCIKTLFLPLYHCKTTDSENYDDVTPLLEDAIISHDHHAHVLDSNEDVLYVCNMV